MKVLIGQFITESNEKNPIMNEVTSYDIAFGDDLIAKMQVGDIFENAGIEIIPSIFAVSGASGVIRRETFDYIESCFVNAVKENISDIDGIYLMLHGASEVEGLGSGDHHILESIRKVVGEYLPIAVACDPHGNLKKEYVESTTILRSYRESPHTDSLDTWRKVAQMLCDLLVNRQNIHSIYRKLPLILGGEQSVSADEPVRSINEYLDMQEQDSRILSCSWHVGYLRHDTDVAGCGVVVVPSTESDTEYANKVADDISKFIWDRRSEFHYTGLTAEPVEALNLALDYKGKPVVITDSGDNTTSGAPGWNTTILRQVLEVKDLNKTVLFASICDPKSYDYLSEFQIGEEKSIALGMGYDDLSQPVSINVKILSKGIIVRPVSIQEVDVYNEFGECVVVNVIGTGIDIIVANHRQSYANDIQFEKAGLNWLDYDVVVVKQGYIFPRLKEKAEFYVMSLTDGATPQNTVAIPFKRIMRPMYPIDNI